MAKDTKAKELFMAPGPVQLYRGAGTIELGKGQYAMVFNTEWDAVDKALSGLSKKHKKERNKE